VADLKPHLFILRNRDATSHLFRVASGLDSLVLGEGQILSQVKKVHEAGQTVAGFSRNLNYLFRYAITAGKRVRTEISISSGAVSVSSAAVELAQMKLPLKLGEIRVCVVGAGKMSKLLVKHLLSKGCRKMVLLNRSREPAEQLAADFPEAEIEYQPLTELMRCAGEAHLVFTSTASVEPLFMREHADALPPVPEEVGGRRLFVDISVPRNVGACVKDSALSWVYNVDDLAEVVASNKEDRRRKALEALPLIDGYLDEFDSYRDGLETVPVIKALRQKVEDMRLAELQRCLKGMGEGLTKKQRKAVEDLSRGIANKLLHGPMTSLRCDAASNRTVEETLENMAALERMFDLKRGPTIR
jgi:glutamyl-tRNA reductase